MGLDSSHDSRADLNRLILEIVLRDFEPFETISERLCAAAPDIAVEDVRQVMLEMLAEDLVGAFLIHADPPYFTPVEATSDTIERFWFLITDKGKKYFQPVHDTRAQVMQH
jgi:hypothetical protein